MNPATLNITALPGVAVAERKALPNCPGVYFVIDGDVVMYIGRAVNLRNRWKNHHRLNQVRGARIVWLAISDAALLDGIEQACIAYFQPALNGSGVDYVDGEAVRTFRVPDQTWDALKDWARNEQRSAGAQLRVILDRAIAEYERERKQEKSAA
jgi:hypothetical protein